MTMSQSGHSEPVGTTPGWWGRRAWVGAHGQAVVSNDFSTVVAKDYAAYKVFIL